MGQQSILQLLQRQCYSALTHSITLTIANLPPHSHLRTSFSRVTPIPYSSFTITTHPSLTVSTHPSLSLHSLSLPLPHSHPSSLTVTPVPLTPPSTQSPLIPPCHSTPSPFPSHTVTPLRLPPLPHCYLSPLTVTPLPLPPSPQCQCPSISSQFLRCQLSVDKR